MPVDKAQIESYLDELNLSPEVRTAVLGDLTSNDQRAVQFVGQRLRHDKFTQSQQQLAAREKEIQDNANTQVTEYAKQLGEAQKKVDRIMKDFEDASISASTANARLRSVKERFQLSDDDIPAVSPTAPVKQDAPAIDIDARLKEFENSLISRLLPDMTAMPMLTAIQFDMARQHEALLGRPISRDEMLDIVRESAKSKQSLDSVWKEKFGIDKLIRQKDIDEAIKVDRAAQEQERMRKASEDALAGISNRNASQPGTSGVLSKKFNPQSPVTDPAPALPSNGSNGNKAPLPQVNGQPLSGADRAAMKWMERRNKGIPMGKEA